MALDTFMVIVGVYPDVGSADADYDLVKSLHSEAELIDAYDAAVVQRRVDGKVKIVRKHETPTRMGGVLGGGVGLATGLVVALFEMRRAEKLQRKQLKADVDEIEIDVASARASTTS